jgi:spore coat protein U-like protein
MPMSKLLLRLVAAMLLAAGWLGVLPVVATPASAQSTVTSCVADGTTLTVQATPSGTSIASAALGLRGTVSIRCTDGSGTAQQVAAPQTCLSFAALGTSGSGPWSLTRQGDSGSSGSDDQILLTPRLANDQAATQANVEYGNTGGDPDSFPIAFDYAAASSSALIRSGTYSGTLILSPILVGTSSADAPTANCTGSTALRIVMAAVAVQFTITVPENCQSAIPSELAFGDVGDITVAHTAQAIVHTTCNSDSDRYNIYIDGGTGSADDALTMANLDASVGGTLPYGLYVDATLTTPFSRTGMGASAETGGRYAATTAAGGSSATIYGNIPVRTTHAPPGAYQDSVIVHVEY